MLRRVHCDGLKDGLVRYQTALKGREPREPPRPVEEIAAKVRREHDPLRARVDAVGREQRVGGDGELGEGGGPRASDAALVVEREGSVGVVDDDEAVAAALDDRVPVDEGRRVAQLLPSALVHIDQRAAAVAREEGADLRIRSQRKVGIREIDKKVKTHPRAHRRIHGIERDRHHREHSPLNQSARCEDVNVGMLALGIVACTHRLRSSLDIEVEQEEVRRRVKRVQ